MSLTTKSSARTRPTDGSPSPTTTLSVNAMRALAVLRISLGFVFLWAFVDKLFGLHYSTPTARAWIHGGSPTKGFLASVEVGPLQSTFHSIAGAGWADWMFMIGLLGIGVALIAGIGLRIAAVCGVALLALMWLAEYPPAQHTSGGAPSQSTNPFMDYHAIYAVGVVAVALCDAGSTWGLGGWWARQPLVERHAWLR